MVEFNIDAKQPVIILNNSSLGMVRQVQDDFYDGVRSAVDLTFTPDIVKLGDAFGTTAMSTDRLEDVPHMLDEASRTKGRYCSTSTSTRMPTCIPSCRSVWGCSTSSRPVDDSEPAALGPGGQQPGVLQRVASTPPTRFQHRLPVGGADGRRLVSRMTITVHVGRQQAEQATKQLANSRCHHHRRHNRPAKRGARLVLVRMHAPPGERTELLNLVHIFRGRVVDVAANSVIIEVTGSAEKSTISSLMRPMASRNWRAVVLSRLCVAMGRASGSSISPRRRRPGQASRARRRGRHHGNV